MPTPLRIAYEGAIYHAISRGNNKSDIFVDDTDRLKYLALLSKHAAAFQLKLYAYVLMTNHVHLLLETPKANISAAMYRLNLEYSCFFNKKHGRIEHLFGGRFKSKLVQKERYFWSVVRYIHINPVKAGMVATAGDYIWSSHLTYAAGCHDKIVDASEPLTWHSKEQIAARRMYIEFLGGPIPVHEWKYLNTFRNGIIGDASFRAMQKAKSQKAPAAF
ncbi:MAG: transposase [Elusimicrobiales bacterium]|jgi:REP element-mobilizing transposase RayT